MAKKTMICGILALSMVLAGTGYAYWTDTLNVTTKATTGELDVTFADLGLYAQYNNDELDVSTWSIYDGIGTDGSVANTYFMRGASYQIIAADGSIADYAARTAGLGNVSFNAEYGTPEALKRNVGSDYTIAAVGNSASDQIKLTVNNMYPGYAQIFRTDILNHGTIAAKLGTLSFGLNDLNEETMNLLGIELALYHKDASVYELSSQSWAAGNTFQLGGKTFVRLSALPSGLLTDIDATLAAYPNGNTREDVDLFIAVAMAPDACGQYTTGNSSVLADNDDTQSQMQEAIITIDFGWDQFNVTACENVGY